MSNSSSQKRFLKHNLAVLLVALGTIGVVALCCDPIPAGSRPEEVWASDELPVPALQASVSDLPRAGEAAELDRQRGRLALLTQTLLLEKGLHKLETVPDYSANFTKQERLEGVLSEPMVMRVRIRQEPFSVHLKWLEGGDVGREVVYVDGENEDRMLVKFGGLEGRMLPTLKLSPHGDRAMAEARYPITEMGIQKLIERILEFRYQDLKLSRGVACEMHVQQQIDHQDCYCFEINYENQDISPKFRKSFIYISQESALPVCVRNYGWPLSDSRNLTGSRLDEATLLECYRYSNIAWGKPGSVTDFELADTNK